MRDAAAFSRSPMLAQAVIWAAAGACVFGLIQHRLWEALPTGRFAENVLIAGLVTLLAWPLRHWRQWSWANALGLVWMLALVWLGGLLPALAVALMLVAAIALGGLVTGPGRPVLSCLIGLAMVAVLVSWTLQLPLHRWWVYLSLLVLIASTRHRALREQLRSAVAGWQAAVQLAPRAAAFAVLLLGVASSAAWLPTMQHDDLAYHAGLPWQLMVHGSYALDPTHQVWALAPWASDVLHAVAQVLARAEARGALNAFWLIASAAGLWQIGANIGLQPTLRWASVALFASLPLTAGLMGGMQTETAATAFTLALAAVILDPGEVRHRAWVVALLFALLCAFKVMHGVAALPLIVWAGWRHRQRLAIGPLIGATLLALVAAASSYVYAWRIAGNPVLPLFNHVFQSPYFAPDNFTDDRWQAGFGADLPWNLTFNTARYLEGWDGGLGFVLIALAGAWLLALLDRRSRALAICATLGMALPLTALQYGRYLHPAMVLLLPPLMLALQRWLPTRSAVALIVAVGLLNLAFQANGHWLLHVGGPKRALASLGNDDALFRRYAPERLIIATIRERAPASGAVLVLSNPYHAELAGRGRTVAWYAPAMQAASAMADADPTGASWEALLNAAGIGEVIVSPETLTAPRQAGLQRSRARLELTVNEVQWWRIPRELSAPPP